VDRECDCRLTGDRGLEIYRLSNATAAATKQDHHPGSGANALIVSAPS